MDIAEYLSEHWGLLILLAGMSTILFADTHLERGILRRTAVVTALVFVYSITCHIETYLGNQTYYTVARPILSAFNYSLIGFILVNIILIIYPKHHKLFWVPALANCILCFVSLKTDVVFYISKDNHFGRGPLGYLTYSVCTIYLIYFVYNVFSNLKQRVEDFALPTFMVITSAMCLIMPLVFDDLALHWFNITIAMEVLFYYIYILQQSTKRDSLTKLLNRQSYYRDSEKYLNTLTACVAMDMNGLKVINDRQGHLAGDLALKTLAKCFWDSAYRNHRVYRIGGDEFVILCLNSSENEVKDLIGRIKEAIDKTEYSCAIGYAMKADDNTMDDLYHNADTNLYEDKKMYYASKGIHK